MAARTQPNPGRPSIQRGELEERAARPAADLELQVDVAPGAIRDPRAAEVTEKATPDRGEIEFPAGPETEPVEEDAELDLGEEGLLGGEDDQAPATPPAVASASHGGQGGEAETAAI